jgi:hypothetical protein
MKRRLSAAIFLLAWTAGSVYAQPVDAHAEKIKDIRKMINLTGGTRIVDQMFTAMSANFKDPKQQEVFAEFRKEFDIGSLLDILIPTYDKFFTAEDIKGIIRFYESPLGQKFIDTQPKVMADCMPKIMQ